MTAAHCRRPAPLAGPHADKATWPSTSPTSPPHSARLLLPPNIGVLLSTCQVCHSMKQCCPSLHPPPNPLALVRPPPGIILCQHKGCQRRLDGGPGSLQVAGRHVLRPLQVLPQSCQSSLTAQSCQLRTCAVAAVASVGGIVLWQCLMHKMHCSLLYYCHSWAGLLSAELSGSRLRTRNVPC